MHARAMNLLPKKAGIHVIAGCISLAAVQLLYSANAGRNRIVTYPPKAAAWRSLFQQQAERCCKRDYRADAGGHLYPFDIQQRCTPAEVDLVVQRISHDMLPAQFYE